MDDWDSLARALRTLHAALLKRARAEYVRERGLTEDEVGPGELLMLATREESFAWLRSLSELMAEIDELRDNTQARQGERLRAAIRAAVEDLLGAPAGDEEGDGKPQGTDFQQRYWRHVHADPEITMAHAAVRQALRPWPAAQSERSVIESHLEAQRKAPRS